MAYYVDDTGIITQTNLTFKVQTDKARGKATKCSRSLYPLLARKSRLLIANKYIIYKSIIRPMVDLFSTHSFPLELAKEKEISYQTFCRLLLFAFISKY